MGKILKDKLHLEINDKTQINNSKAKFTKFLGANIIYTKEMKLTNKEKDAEGRDQLQRVTTNRAQLYAPIKDICDRLEEKGYLMKTAKGLRRSRGRRMNKLVMCTDEEIVKHHNSVIRGIINYYSFASKRSAL